MRPARLRRWLLVAGVSGLIACDGDGPGTGTAATLEVTTVSPAANATDVETGATISVAFNQAIDPATLTAQTFLVKRGGVALPATVTYEAATRTARATAPLLPDSTYEVEVTAGVRTSAGVALSAPLNWSFGTRQWQSVTVAATGFVGPYTALAIEPGGRRHVSYYDQTNSDLRYATCATNCGVAASWRTGAVDTAGSRGVWTSLAVGANGQVHISYRDFTNFDLKYATCAAACTVTASWRMVAVDTAGAQGNHTSVAVDASGRVHITYYGAQGADLKYATCAVECGATTSWQVLAVDATGLVGQHTSLVAEPGGGLHVSYYDQSNGAVKYAACATSCAIAASWQPVTVFTAGDVGHWTSLVRDGSGRLHIAYYDITNADLKYSSCATDCTTPGAWQSLTVDGVGDVGQHATIAADGGGRVHVVYFDATNGALKYGTCATDCASVTSWRAVTANFAGSLGQFSGLAIDGGGRLHVTCFADQADDLVYIH